MKSAMLCMLLVLAVASSESNRKEKKKSIEVSESSLTFDAADAKGRPVSKVITLLKDMMKQMKKEAEEDEDVYDKMACWSETTIKEKTKSIADANTRISDLSTSIEQKTAQGARLNTEIANLNKEAAEDQAALDEATAIRAKQLAEFNTEEKDVLLTISSLKNAIISLSKHNSFMQSPGQMDGVAAAVQEALQKHALLLSGVLTPTQRREMFAFVQGPGQVAQSGGYAPQSGEIFGILKQMKETFETNLAASQKEEKSNIKACDDLKAAKAAEIRAGQDQADAKSDQLAENNDQLAQHKQDKRDTEKSLAADEKFMENVKNNYASEKTEYEARVKTRSEELEAVTTAEGVLNSDDAHDLFSKTFNPGFLQTQTDMTSDRRAQAAKLLSAVAQKVQNPRLAVLAGAVRLDAFVKVRKAIDEMVVALGKEKQDEIKKKDFCREEFNKNAMEEHLTIREKTDIEAKITQLTAAITKLNDEIATLESEIVQLQADLKKAGETRDKQRKEFQSTVADQRASQKVLASAMNVLKGFYAKKAAASLVQTHQPIPAGGDAYKKSGASGKVLAMIQQIITDAKAMEAEAVRDEAAAEKAHEKFTKETNEVISVKNDSIANKKATRADKSAAKVEAKKDLEATMLELEQLGNTKAELHQSCDFVLKNFDVRQTARDEEVDALKQAKSILSGSKFEAFLQSQ